jgi:hypothetical protein
MRHLRPTRRLAALLALALGLASAPSTSSAQSPPCQIYGPSSGCGVVALCGPGGEYRWEWFAPDGALFSTSRCVEARATGTYGLVVIGPTGSRSERCQQFVTVGHEPACSIEGPARVCAGESVRLCGPEGNFTFAWSGPNGFSASTSCVDVAGPGTYSLELWNAGEDCPSTCVHELSVETCVRNHPPDCSQATPSVAKLWPPNHDLVPVRIDGVTDPDGDPVAVTVTSITQDESVEGVGDGDQAPDARVEGSSLWLRAERGQGNGRVYEISFTARDGQGGECSGRVSVCVPRGDTEAECTDDGQRFGSLEASATGASRIHVRERKGRHAVLEYKLESGDDVRVEVIDVTGRRITVLERGPRAAGTHAVEWNMTGAARGVYMVHLRTSAGQRAHTLVCVQ